MATWRFNPCRRRPRSARYYQVFGREPEYSYPLLIVQFLNGVFKCILYYGLLFLLIKWYLWPVIVPNLMKYEFAQKTLNHSSILIHRLRSNRKLPFE